MVGKPIPNVYKGESLSGHIRDWFEARYGDRLKVDFSPGCFPIEIRRDLYLFRLPLIFGSARFFIDRLQKPPAQKLNFNRGPAPCNLLDLIVDLTRGTRHSLSDEELNSISQTCAIAFKQLSAWQAAGKQFQAAIHDDLKLSATLAVEQKFALSRWHSLQSAEKALKKFIAKRHGSASYVHNLKKLNHEAVGFGLSPLSSTDLVDAQCDAEVRYNTAGSNQSNALAANQAARRICSSIAMQLASEIRRK